MVNTDEIKDSITNKWPTPISFLNDYKNFAVKARPLLIKLMAEKHSMTEDVTEKKLLHLLALEQFFFYWETWLAFYCAAYHPAPIDLYNWLTKPFERLNSETEILSREDLYSIYKSEHSNLTDNEVEYVVNSLQKNINWMKKVAPITDIILPAFYKLKHKSLIYRLEDEVVVLLSKKLDVNLVDGIKQEERGWAGDLFWLVKLAEVTQKAICGAIDIIIIRLKKSGNNKWLSGPGKNIPLFDLQKHNKKHS